MQGRKSNVFIISAPSGAGKSTLIQLLLAHVPSLFFSISHTTRPPREGEKDGVEYFFVDGAKFEKMIAADEFLEWANVHGYFYGTSREMIRIAEQQGKDLLLDVDVQGAGQVRRLVPDATSIFIMPPSQDALRERLRRRQKDTEEQIRQRLENARDEIQHHSEYEYVVINEDLNSIFESLVSIVRSHGYKREIEQDRIEKILKSFDILT